MTTAKHYPTLYRATWVWRDNYLYCQAFVEGKDKAAKSQPKQTQELSGDKAIIMIDNVDQTQQKLFKQKYLRTLKNNIPNIITIQDIKDVVIFSIVSYIPKSALEVFLSHEINSFLRALIVYIQFYLQVKDDLLFREVAYTKNQLKHPISVVRESMCRKQLNKIKIRIGQEYAMVICGESVFKKHHHMNNNINRSYMTKDIELFDYLIKLSARVVWIALHRTNYKEIEFEISRLLSYKSTKDPSDDVNYYTDKKILYGDQCITGSHWEQKSPVIAELLLNKDITNSIRSTNEISSSELKRVNITGLEAALTLPEEVLEICNITVGILGQEKDNFETMLHIKQAPKRTLEEEEIEYLMSKLEELEKPSKKMYQYLNDLERNINLASIDGTYDIMDKIEYYNRNHVEDSANAFKMWKCAKLIN